MQSDNTRAPDARATFNDAVKLHQAGRLREAETIYRQVLETEPDHFGSLHLLGAIDLQRGRHAEAVRKIDAAIRLNANVAEAFDNRGTALRKLQRFDEALVSHERAIELKPDYAEAFNNRGNALLEMKRLDEALTSYDRAIALKPDYAEAHNNRGNVLLELKRREEAVASYDSAIVLNPRYAHAYSNRGGVYAELNRFEEALSSYDASIALRPDHAGAFYNRATVLREMKRLDEAFASFDKVIALKGDDAEAYTTRSMLKLLVGRFGEGWAEFEWRKKLKRLGIPQLGAPHWRGEDLAGRHIAIYGEFHFGDIIHFARYLPLLAARGAKVTFFGPTKLNRLLRSLTPEIVFADNATTRSRFDFQCALMSLPFLFGTDLSSIPNRTPYLSAESDLVARWKHNIGDVGFKIGIAWEGRPQRTLDRRRFAVTEFSPLAQLPGVRLISLQKEFAIDQLGELPSGLKVETLGDFDDGPDAFIDTAAVMESLDLVITSDTSIAHLAGALGRPTWVALKHVPDWRWLLDRDDSPWYPTLRLFRQETIGNWASVFSGMERELRSLVR